MENETIGSMKNESSVLNNNSYLSSKSLLAVGCIGAAFFSTAALLHPISAKFSLVAAWCSTIIIGIPLVVKRTKDMAACNKERFLQMGKETFLQRNKTMNQLLKESEKTIASAHAGANVLADTLWSIQMFAWFISFIFDFNSGWQPNAVSTLVVMITLSIYTMFAGRILGNKFLTYLGFIPCITGIIYFDKDPVQLFWFSAAAYAIAFIIPSLVMMIKEKKN